jgi:replicative superfamily II helicase
LSATLSSTEELSAWLRPCDVVSVTERTPPLETWLIELDEGADANETIASWLRTELSEPASQALVFIYQARQTASTAEHLTRLLGELAGAAGALPYHSQLSPAQRRHVRKQFENGASRVVVTTSALAMGVNMPATHVVVRDLTYVGARSPGVAEMTQMMGRAGRGERAGKALVVKRGSDRWDTDELIALLRDERLPPLTSVLAQQDQMRATTSAPLAAEAVASLLLRAGDAGRSAPELEAFFEHSLGGRAIAPQVRLAMRWLQDQLLAVQGE